MEVTFYGTRGSIAISRPDSVEFGGNTTCLRIHSECIPEGKALVVDTGTGFLPCSRDLLGESVMDVSVLFTHYHHDHTGGMLLAPHTFIPAAKLRLWGPKEHGMGPTDMMKSIMLPPLFPVDFGMVRHRFTCHDLKHLGTQVLVVHPEVGFSLMKTHVFERAVSEGKQLALKGDRYPVSECLVVRMLLTQHPEYTVSYRFEERPTDRVFVFLTDHENTDGIPSDLRRHLAGAHLLVQDVQYSREHYNSMAAGFGHGTPDYCARVAAECGVGAVGITHHDPGASDDDVNVRLAELHTHLADEHGKPELVDSAFACKDYQRVEV